ncbi:MAG: DUF4268 domain-containing protein [Oscillospiraceae bacterium]|nr:DUF4268 domain-containing protein [Oscillospiraceae bacterium]
MNIGKLEEVDIRDLWAHEQYNFSEWLSREENIEYLNDILGLTLVDIEKEKSVGAFYCDIVAKDEMSDITVIIENQLEPTNHDHLGKIITYASGLNANVIVWIVKEAREEHRSAVEWLNNVTDSNTNFFLIEIHAYKIGDSVPAPKFEIIEEPNGFIKNTRGQKDSKEISQLQSEYLTFWTEFNNVVNSEGKPFNPKKPRAKHYYNIAIGTSKAVISVTLNKKSQIGVELYIKDDKDLFDYLYSHKDEIERELSFELDWRRLDNKNASRILHYFDGLDFNYHSNYKELSLKIIEKVEAMKKVFTKYININ